MPHNPKSKFTRREWLAATIVTGGATLVGVEPLCSALMADELRKFKTAAPSRDEFSGGKHLGNIDFTCESRVPLDSVLGAELDGRLYTDLSSLEIDHAVTPTEKFYIRTRASKLLDTSKPWSITIGEGENQKGITVQEILRDSIQQGVHLTECAGNTKDAHFGMMSAADWAGVPISKLSAWLPIKNPSARILIAGFDTYSAGSTSSVAGASWIFSWDELLSSNAFFATKMNGQPLTPDHGAPVRLIVPGWYGCACIKWVNAISIVEESAAATSQMQEYAFRTHQQGIPKLASEYESAKPDPAALPIRVEKWLVNNQIKYRVVGIAWGGSQPEKEWQIQFNPGEDFIAVENFQPSNIDSWRFWSHTWTPRKLDTYIIRLRVADRSVRTRRLDMGFYARAVRITEV
jgi:DMSO/TMAO reductase YedYZ molybdopterin-dependent catalytic subunit